VEPGVSGWARRRERVRGGDVWPNGREALDRTRRGAGARVVPVLLLRRNGGCKADAILSVNRRVGFCFR
jgi:hypothetical protein